MPELPSPEELMARQPPELPPNITPGQVMTKDEYLETQYRLYRHDGTEHLRRAITAFASNSDWEREAFVYNKVWSFLRPRLEGFL